MGNSKTLQVLHDLINNKRALLLQDKYSVPMSEVREIEVMLKNIQEQKKFSLDLPLAKKTQDDFDILKREVTKAEITRPKHLKEKHRKKAKQTSAINPMNAMLEEYISSLQTFSANSKKKSPPAIVSLLISLKEAADTLKAPTSDRADKINALHKAEGKISQVLLLKDIQQLKNSSRGFFVNQDKVALGKFITKLESDRPQWQELLKTLGSRTFKFVK